MLLTGSGVLAQARENGFQWTDEGVTIAAILVTAILVSVGARLLVRRFRRKLEGTSSETQTIDLRRAATLTNALSTAAVVVIWTLAILLVLSNLNVNLAPLFASAGVVGVALGFGAQTIVRDTLAGLFIPLEGQFDVGDIVDLQTTAARSTARSRTSPCASPRSASTTGRSHGAERQHPCGLEHRGVGSRDRRRARRLGRGPRPRRRVLDELFAEARTTRPLQDWLRERPRVLGVEPLTDFAVVVRVVADTAPQPAWTPSGHCVSGSARLRRASACRCRRRRRRAPASGPDEAPGLLAWPP